MKTQPHVVVRAAPRPVATVTTTVRPSAPVATPTAKPPASRPARRAATRRAASRRRKTVRRHQPATHVALLRPPHLTLAQLSAPPADTDAGRARKLAVGGLSLLVLALASATLLAFTAHVERRRVVR